MRSIGKTTDEIYLGAIVKNVNDFFEHELQFLGEHHAHLKEAARFSEHGRPHRQRPGQIAGDTLRYYQRDSNAAKALLIRRAHSATPKKWTRKVTSRRRFAILGGNKKAKFSGNSDASSGNSTLRTALAIRCTWCSSISPREHSP
ncbi:hypothetical protein pipiens_006810 [Culex pipiens pipiens]|uniref:Uncharacterized protein n=1 Tax=Culex pipiens pipiens TaxID=38569 RepID=A0ABD1DP62_CULPP